MKRFILPALLCLLALASSAFAQSDPAASEQQLLALVRDVQTQQAAIAENQTKIDAKLAIVAEAVRLARIYASRGH